MNNPSSVNTAVLRVISERPDLFFENPDPEDFRTLNDREIEDAVTAVRMYYEIDDIAQALARREVVMAQLRVVLKSLSPKCWDYECIDGLREEFAKDSWYDCSGIWEIDSPSS